MPWFWPGLPLNELEEHKEQFNICGYMLYDQLDKDIIEFMSENANLIDTMAGEKVYIVYFEKANLTDDYWLEEVREVFGDDADEYLKEWEKIKPSDRNRSHKIADELHIPSSMFPCIIFTKSLISKESTKPYPIINDIQFYRDLFSYIKEKSEDPNITLEELDEDMGPIKRKWFIPKNIGDRITVYEKYTNPIINFVKPIIEIISPFI
jgi:hypothetical protein